MSVRHSVAFVCLSAVVSVGCAHHGRAPATVSAAAAASTCPDLSGSYAFTPASCRAWEGMPFDGLPIAAMGGYHVVRDPQVIRVEQTDCKALRFTARARLMHGDSYPVDARLQLATGQTRRLEWAPQGLMLEYRPRNDGPRFPGVSRNTAYLELTSTEHGLRYRYKIVERGLALLIVPFRDIASADCALARINGSSR